MDSVEIIIMVGVVWNAILQTVWFSRDVRSKHK